MVCPHACLLTHEWTKEEHRGLAQGIDWRADGGGNVINVDCHQGILLVVNTAVQSQRGQHRSHKGLGGGWMSGGNHRGGLPKQTLYRVSTGSNTSLLFYSSLSVEISCFPGLKLEDLLHLSKSYFQQQWSFITRRGLFFLQLVAICARNSSHSWFTSNPSTRQRGGWSLLQNNAIFILKTDCNGVQICVSDKCCCEKKGDKKC